jgi:hypothetical protein
VGFKYDPDLQTMRFVSSSIDTRQHAKIDDIFNRLLTSLEARISIDNHAASDHQRWKQIYIDAGNDHQSKTSAIIRLFLELENINHSRKK